MIWKSSLISCNSKYVKQQSTGKVRGGEKGGHDFSGSFTPDTMLGAITRAISYYYQSAFSLAPAGCFNQSQLKPEGNCSLACWKPLKGPNAAEGD